MRILLVLLASVSFQAMSAAEWYEDLSSRAQFRALADLRAPLDAAPEDPVLLGRAAIAYVNLGIGIAPSEGQAPGPFLRYARTCLDLRAARLPLAACTTLDEAAPELWYLVQVGRCTEVAQVLDRLPAAAGTPLGRALRCLVDRDWRTLDQRGGRTAIEDFALLQAYGECRLVDRLERLPTEMPGIGEMTRPGCFQQAKAFSHAEPTRALRQALADTALALTAAGVADGRAIALATPLARALRVAVSADRLPLIGRIAAAAATADLDDGRIAAAAWDACEGLLDEPAGIRDAHGVHRLFQAADVAAWARDRLIWAAWDRLLFLIDHLHDDGAVQQFAGGALAASPGGFLGSYLHVRVAAGRWGNRSAPVGPLLAAIDREFARGTGRLRDDMLLRGIWAAHAAGGGIGDRAVRLAGLRSPQAMRVWTMNAKHLDNEAALNAGREAAFAADPWCIGLRYEPDEAAIMPVVDGLPQRERITEAVIDQPSLPFTGVAGPEFFALRWEGAIDGAAGGEPLAITSDDGTVLRIDGRTAAENGAVHAAQLVATTRPLAPGWHDLRVDFWQGFGGASCQLLIGTSDGQWRPVPAQRLGHRVEGRIEPGLLRTEWVLPRFAAYEEDIRYAPLNRSFAAFPWRLTERSLDAQTRLRNGEGDAALAILRDLAATEAGTWDVVRPYGEALEQRGDLDGAVAAYRGYLARATGFDTIYANRSIGRLRAKQHRPQEAEVAFRAAAASWQSGAMTDYADFLGRQGRYADAAQWYDRDAERYGDRSSVDAAPVCRYLAGTGSASQLDAHRAGIAQLNHGDYTPMVLGRLVADADPIAAALLQEPRSAIAPGYAGLWKLALGDLAAARDMLLQAAGMENAPLGFRAHSALLAATLEPAGGEAHQALGVRLGDMDDEERGLALGVLDGTWPPADDTQPSRPANVHVLRALIALGGGDRAAALRELDAVGPLADPGRLTGLAPVLRRLAAGTVPMVGQPAGF